MLSIDPNSATQIVDIKDMVIRRREVMEKIYNEKLESSVKEIVMETNLNE